MNKVSLRSTREVIVRYKELIFTIKLSVFKGLKCYKIHNVVGHLIRRCFINLFPCIVLTMARSVLRNLRVMWMFCWPATQTVKMSGVVMILVLFSIASLRRAALRVCCCLQRCRISHWNYYSCWLATILAGRLWEALGLCSWLRDDGWWPPCDGSLCDDGLVREKKTSGGRQWWAGWWASLAVCTKPLVGWWTMGCRDALADGGGHFVVEDITVSELGNCRKERAPLGMSRLSECEDP